MTLTSLEEENQQPKSTTTAMPSKKLVWIIVAGVVVVVTVIGAIVVTTLPSNSSNIQNFSCIYSNGPLPVTISSNSTNVSVAAESSIFIQHWACFGAGGNERVEFNVLLVDDLWSMPVVPAITSGPDAGLGSFLWVYTDNGGQAAYSLTFRKDDADKALLLSFEDELMVDSFRVSQDLVVLVSAARWNGESSGNPATNLLSLQKLNVTVPSWQNVTQFVQTNADVAYFIANTMSKAMDWLNTTNVTNINL